MVNCLTVGFIITFLHCLVDVGGRKIISIENNPDMLEYIRTGLDNPFGFLEKVYCIVSLPMYLHLYSSRIVLVNNSLYGLEIAWLGIGSLRDNQMILGLDPQFSVFSRLHPALAEVTFLWGFKTHFQPSESILDRYGSAP